MVRKRGASKESSGFPRTCMPCPCARMHARNSDIMQEEMRAGQAASMRTEPHPSFQNVMGATLAANKGHFMAPAQLAELAEAQLAAQVLSPCPSSCALKT